MDGRKEKIYKVGFYPKVQWIELSREKRNQSWVNYIHLYNNVNVFTFRQTQWDLPTWDQGDQDDMDLGTPTHDEPQNKVSFAVFFFLVFKAVTLLANFAFRKCINIISD